MENSGENVHVDTGAGFFFFFCHWLIEAKQLCNEGLQSFSFAHITPHTSQIWLVSWNWGLQNIVKNLFNTSCESQRCGAQHFKAEYA